MSYCKKNVIYLLLFIIFPVIGTTHASDTELIIMTEEFPPFNYQKGEIVDGIATKIVRKLLDEAQLKYKIEIVPWKRAYETTLHRPNTLIYTIAKTDARMNKFHWICKISNRKLIMFRLRSRQDLANMTIEEAKKRAKIAVIQGDASTENVIAMGFPTHNLTMIRDTTSGNLCVRHVMGGRSDFFLMNPYTMKYRVDNGDLPDLFEDQYVIHDDDGYYIAANLKTNPSILRALMRASESLQENGYIDKIISEYLRF